MAVTMKTTVSQGAQSVENNTTKITVKTTVTSTNGSYNLNNPSGTYKVYKNSTSGTVLAEGTFSHDINSNTTTEIFKKTFTLTHDSDGTLDIVVVVTFATGISAGTLKNTVEKTLSDIARESTVSAVSCDIGESTVITINRNSDSFKHTLQYGYSKSPSVFYNIVSKTSRTSYGWTVPDEAFSKCPDAKYVNITIKCITYSGSKEIGTDTCSFKAYANEDDCKPSVDITVAEDTNAHSLALTGDKKRIIKGVSDLSYTVVATAKNEATRKSITVTNGSQSLSAYSGKFEKATSATIKATVKDSRGYSNSDTENLTLVDYNGLSIGASIKWKTPTGNIIAVTLSGNYSNVNFGAKNNELKLYYKCIPKSVYDEKSSNLSDASYVAIPVTPTIDTAKKRFTVSFEIDKITTADVLLDYREAYSLRFMAIDMVFDSSDDGDHKHKWVTKHLASALPIFDWGKNDFNFNVPVYYKGYNIFYDSGWLYPTLNSNFENYASSQKVMYRKVGKQVFIRGALRPTKTLDTNSTQAAFNLPEGFRPTDAEHFVCQGSNSNKWLCTVTSSGEVNVSRYGTTDQGSVSTSTWLTMSVSFLVG